MSTGRSWRWSGRRTGRRRSCWPTATRIACGAVVNAAGASGGRQLAAAAGIDIPVYARKRCVFTFHCRGDVARAPLLIDVSGCWFRPEWTARRRGADVHLAAEDRVGRSRVMRPTSRWSGACSRTRTGDTGRARAGIRADSPGAGLGRALRYERLDHNAIVGLAAGTRNIYLANGFLGPWTAAVPAVAGTGRVDRARALRHARPVRPRSRADRGRPAFARAQRDLIRVSSRPERGGRAHSPSCRPRDAGRCGNWPPAVVIGVPAGIGGR